MERGVAGLKDERLRPALVAALSDAEVEMVKLWEAESGREVRTLQGHTGYVFSVAFSPDGHYLASGSVNKKVKLWEVTGQK